MNIICVSHWRFPAEKTMTPYMMRVAEAFANEGADVEFWVPRRRNTPELQNTDPFEYHAIEKNFSIKRLPVIDVMNILPGRFGFYLMLGSFTIVLFFYVLFLKGRGKKVFYFFDLRDAWTTLLLSKNVFSEIHMYYHSSLEIINRFGFKYCAGIIAATKPLLNDIKKAYNVLALHAPCGVSSERFAIDVRKEDARNTLGLPQNKTLIFYIGHLFPVKGVDVLFDIHSKLAQDEVLYFIGGTDEDIERFQTKWEKAGSPENVVIAGRKPHQEIPLWLRASDILTIPNTAKEAAGSIESSPSKLMEYMASGRPIIASDVPAIRDVLDDSMGYFAKPDSPESIVEKIREVLSDPKKAEEKAATARSFAKNELSWNARAKKIMRFIREKTGSRLE